MEALTEATIRASFVNCSQGEARRLKLPRDLRSRPWDDLDFLGWSDPDGSDRSYVVAWVDDHPVGITLRWTSHRQAFLRRSMCSLCYTPHGGAGVALMAGRKVGSEGRKGSTVGMYICTDLACSLYVRGKKIPSSGSRLRETLSVEEQVTRMMGNLDKFFRNLGVAVP